MTYTSGTDLGFGGRSSFSITSAGKTLSTAVTIKAPGGTYALADALTTNGGALTLTAGTFDSSSFSISANLRKHIFKIIPS